MPNPNPAAKAAPYPGNTLDLVEHSVTAVSLKALTSLDKQSCAALRDSLIQERYAVISIDNASAQTALVEAVNQFDPEQTFRFPARDGISNYDETNKACFGILYRAALTFTRAILEAEPSLTESFPVVAQSLAEALHPDFELFAGEDTNAPFSSADAPFAHTFFNIFNYDHGMLNEHKDRGLVTAIYISPNKSGSQSVSQLWVGRGGNDWVAMDALVDGGQFVVFVGEELEAMGKQVGLDFLAVEHSVRVAPQGEYVSHSHQRRDPDAQASGNRKSAALVLCS